MEKKLVGIFVCTLMIAAAVFPVTGIVNVKTIWNVNENNYSQPHQYTPTFSGDLMGVKIEGKVYEVTDPMNLLGGAIKVNDTIKGKYIYDKNGTDTNPDPKLGFYWFNSSPCGIEVTIGNFIFKTDPNDLNFVIGIYNDMVAPFPYPGDGIEIGSNNGSNLSNGLMVTLIGWALYDPSGTVLSSDALLTTTPNISDWEQSTYGFGLILQGKSPSNWMWTFTIKAEVTKATKSKAKNIEFTTHPILLWLLERFPNIFPIIRHLMGQY